MRPGEAARQSTALVPKEEAENTEGLKALADAKKVIAATSGEAEALASLVQGPSFLQVSSGSSPTFKGASFVRGATKEKGSAALAQLSSRLGAALDSASGEAPSALISGFISGVIAKLEDEAGADAAETAMTTSRRLFTSPRSLPQEHM
jgi:hypothetical protein